MTEPDNYTAKKPEKRASTLYMSLLQRAIRVLEGAAPGSKIVLGADNPAIVSQLGAARTMKVPGAARERYMKFVRLRGAKRLTVLVSYTGPVDTVQRERVRAFLRKTQEKANRFLDTSPDARYYDINI